MLCCIGEVKGVLESLQQPTRQTKQADSVYEGESTFKA